MAQRRMFNKAIIDSDLFYSIPFESQILYIHLGMHADSRGFIEPKKIARLAGIKIESIKDLITTGLVIPFESGVVVITDWNMNNQIRHNKEAPTIYIKELESLELNNGKYLLQANAELTPGKLPEYSRKTPGKVPAKSRKTPAQKSIEEYSIEEYSKEEKRRVEKTGSITPATDTTLDSNCQLVLDEWNKVNSTSLKSKREFRENLGFWLSEGYTIEEILYAIRRKVLVPDKFLKDISIVTFFRKSNSQGACNYIEQVLNYKLGEADGTKQRPDEHALEMHKFGETMYTIADLGSDRIDYLNGKGFELEKASHILDRKEDGYIKSYIVYKDNTLRDLID